MTKANTSHDISFIRNNGLEVGLMLADGENGKAYQRYDDPQLAQQFFTGEADYSHMPPEKEISIIQNSAKAGFGLEFANGDDPDRYYTSLGGDCRFGKVICGPVVTDYEYVGALYSGEVQSDAVITDGDLEVWTSATELTNWTETGGATLDRVAGRTGYAARFTGGADGTVYQDLAWSASYQNRYCTVNCMVASVDITKARAQLTIDDGVTTTTVSCPVSSTSYRPMSVSHVMDNAATRCRIILKYDYITATSAVYFDEVKFIQPKLLMLHNDGAFYMALGCELYVKSGAPADEGWIFIDDFPAPITDLESFDDGYLYVCLGDLNKYWYYDPVGATSTESNLADGYATFMKNVKGVMYKCVQPNEIKKATDPSNAGSWSTALYVGSESTDFTALEADVDIPYIGKEDSVWYLDTEDVAYPLISEMCDFPSPNNCRNMIVWHKKLYFPWGKHGLGEYDYATGGFNWRSPSLFQTNLSEFTGKVTALARDEEYLYAIVSDGTTYSYVLAGKINEVEDREIWAWHPVARIGMAECECAFITDNMEVAQPTSQYNYKRLYLFSTDYTDHIYYIPITEKYADITSDTKYSFLTGSYFVTPWYHSNLKSDDKAFFKLSLTTEGCDDNNYVTAEYQLYYTALNGTWKKIGDFKESPTQTLYMSAGTPTAPMIRFRFTIVTNATTTTPKLIAWDCRGVWRPDKRKIIQCTVKAGDNVLNRNGTKDESEKSIREAIEEQNNRVWPTVFYDIAGNEKYVIFLSATQKNVNLILGSNPEYEYELILQEVTL